MYRIFFVIVCLTMISCTETISSLQSPLSPARYISDQELNQNTVWLNHNELTFFNNGTYHRDSYAFEDGLKQGTQSGTWIRKESGAICVKETYTDLPRLATNNCYKIQKQGDGLKCFVAWGGRSFVEATDCYLKPLSIDVVRAASNQNIFTVTTGFQAVNRGPEAAKGVIYYFGGHSPSRPTPINDNIVQPHVISLNQQGWDVLRANPPIKFRTISSRHLLVENMNKLALSAKENGYKKVVFIGQSFGGWSIMQASEDAQFDKFIAVAPATYGLSKNATDLARWEKSMLHIVPMGQKSTVPGLVFLFKDDEFYTDAVQDGVANASYANVSVIDRPPGFKGHGSAWLDAFDFIYGDCIAQYLASTESDFSCPKKTLSLQDHRWMAEKDHLEQGGATLVGPEEARQLLLENTIAGRAGSNLLNLYFVSNKQMLIEFRSGYNNGEVQRVRYDIKGSKLCGYAPYFKQDGGDGCYAFYKWPNENLYLAVARHGGIVFRGRLLTGNPRNLQ